VVITGAFLTGHALAVRLGSYGDLQTRLAQSLPGMKWRTDHIGTTPGTYRTAGGGGFSEAIPLVVARCRGVDYLPWLREALEECKSTVVARAIDYPSGLKLEPTRLAVDVYDLGVAVMTARFELPEPPAGSLTAAARAVKRLVWLRPDNGVPTPLAETLDKIAREITREYGDAVTAVAGEELVAGKWRSGRSSEDSNGDADLLAREYGRLLWLHPVYVLRRPMVPAESVTMSADSSTGAVSDSTGGTAINDAAPRVAVKSRADHETAARALSPAFHQTIDLEGGLFAPGIGSSALVVDEGTDAEEAPLRLTELHWAYYALYIGIDRNLLGVLNLPMWDERSSLRRLEADADDVFADYRRITDARARLDSQLSALGGDEYAIWDKIAEVQRYNAVLDAVDRKVDALEKLAERRVVLAAADRARAVGNVLRGLSALTLVGVAGGITGLLIGSRSPRWGPSYLPLVLIAVVLVVTAIVFVGVLREHSSTAGKRGAPARIGRALGDRGP